MASSPVFRVVTFKCLHALLCETVTPFVCRLFLRLCAFVGLCLCVCVCRSFVCVSVCVCSVAVVAEGARPHSVISSRAVQSGLEV